MTNYGFPPSIFIELLAKKAVFPGDYNIYGTTRNPVGYPPLDSSNYKYNIQQSYEYNWVNDSSVQFGNPMLPINCNDATIQANDNFPDWISTLNYQIDLRGIYLNCNQTTGAYSLMFNWPNEYIPTKSPISGYHVAFTTETIFYAQSSYFVTIVMIQWSNVFACKSRKVPKHLNIDFSHIFWAKQAYVRRGYHRDCVVYLFVVCAGSQQSFRRKAA